MKLASGRKNQRPTASSLGPGGGERRIGESDDMKSQMTAPWRCIMEMIVGPCSSTKPLSTVREADGRRTAKEQLPVRKKNRCYKATESYRALQTVPDRPVGPIFFPALKLK